MRTESLLEKQIISELYGTLVLLGAKHDLLGLIGSWGAGELPEDYVLDGLKDWNRSTMKELRERIEHYEISRPQSGHNQGEAQKTPVQAQ